MAGVVGAVPRGAGRWRIPADVGALCLAIILADTVAGIVIPTFSLHATSLGDRARGARRAERA